MRGQHDGVQLRGSGKGQRHLGARSGKGRATLPHVLQQANIIKELRGTFGIVVVVGRFNWKSGRLFFFFLLLQWGREHLGRGGS